MSASLSPQTARLPEDDIYLRLRRQLGQVRELDLQIKNLTQEREQLMRSCQDMAQTIEHNAIDSPRFVLRGCKTIKRRTIDVQALRRARPDIYDESHPYVDEKIICEILQAAKPGWSLQEMAEEMRPEIYHDNARIKIGDLEKVIGKGGMLQLEDAGIVKVNLYVSGEPEVISRDVAEAKPRGELEEADDE